MTAKIRKQMTQIEELKAKIKKKREDCDADYNLEIVRNREDAIIDLKRVFSSLEEEKTIMERMLLEQKKHLKEEKENKEEKGRKRLIIDKIDKTKAENKILIDKIAKLQKEANAIDAKNIKERLDIRRDQQIIEEQRQGKFGQKNMETIIHEINQFEGEIEELKRKKEEITEVYETRFNELEKKKKGKEAKREKIEKKYKEKDKFFRLNVLKLASAKRGKRYNSLEPMTINGMEKLFNKRS